MQRGREIAVANTPYFTEIFFQNYFFSSLFKYEFMMNKHTMNKHTMSLQDNKNITQMVDLITSFLFIRNSSFM